MLPSSRKVIASVQTRRGDWAMRMRFWGVNTRETEGAGRLATVGARLTPPSPVACPNHHA